MVNKKRTRRPPQNTTRTQEAPGSSAQFENEPTALPNSTDTQGPLRTIVKKFGDWAVKKALDYLLVGVLAIMTAPTIAIWVYFRSGRAAWTYPWLHAAFGFITACALIITASSLVAFIRRQRRQAVEHAINFEFLSKDKGYLDHALNQARAFKTFNSLLHRMAKEMGEIGGTNRAATAQIQFAQRLLATRPNLLAYFGHKIASRTAKKTNRHAAAMQLYLSNLQATSDLLIESITGYTVWFVADTDEQAQTLIGNKVGLQSMVAEMRTSIKSTQGFRDAQKGIYGISQELNTAVNRMVNVIDGVLNFLTESDVKWNKVIELMDEKLRAWNT
jgi:hypothetical protein